MCSRMKSYRTLLLISVDSFTWLDGLNFISTNPRRVLTWRGNRERFSELVGNLFRWADQMSVLIFLAFISFFIGSKDVWFGIGLWEFQSFDGFHVWGFYKAKIHMTELFMGSIYLLSCLLWQVWEHRPLCVFDFIAWYLN
jgi:hypothetical protein